MQKRTSRKLAILAIGFASASALQASVYISCKLTSGDNFYISTCRPFKNIGQAINFCNNEWYKIIGSPELTHVRSVTSSNSNNTLTGCESQLNAVLNYKKPYSDSKILISNKGGVESFIMPRDLSEDQMPTEN